MLKVTPYTDKVVKGDNLNWYIETGIPGSTFSVTLWKDLVDGVGDLIVSHEFSGDQNGNATYGIGTTSLSTGEYTLSVVLYTIPPARVNSRIILSTSKEDEKTDFPIIPISIGVIVVGYILSKKTGE